jgi:hypothetical protein
MKYVIIAALVGLVFLLVYARVRPYLKLIRKVAKSFEVVPDVKRTPTSSKLVRCERCGTWIPTDRALTLSSGLATFCSPECMAKEPVAKNRKIAG